MTDRPIIFSAPMVRALLDGRKTQTRRVSGLQDVNQRPDAWSLHNVGPLGYMAKPSAKGKFGATFESREIEHGTLMVCPQKLPFGVGDRLYVREAHAIVPASAYRLSDGVEQRATPDSPDTAVIFREGFDRSAGGLRWRPSIHMPRWASRLTLTVTDVRVQRLQAISEADAVAEGVERWGLATWKDYTSDGATHVVLNCRHSFSTLWNSLHGHEAWDANPWIAAYTFEVHNCNIDAMERNAL